MDIKISMLIFVFPILLSIIMFFVSMVFSNNEYKAKKNLALAISLICLLASFAVAIFAYSKTEDKSSADSQAKSTNSSPTKQQEAMNSVTDTSAANEQPASQQTKASQVNHTSNTANISNVSPNLAIKDIANRKNNNKTTDSTTNKTTNASTPSQNTYSPKPVSTLDTNIAIDYTELSFANDFTIVNGTSSKVYLSAFSKNGTSFDICSYFKWTSSDPKVAIVDSVGLVTAIAEGVCDINYTQISGQERVNAQSGNFSIKVIAKHAPVLMPITSSDDITSLNISSMILDDGGSPITSARIEVSEVASTNNLTLHPSLEDLPTIRGVVTGISRGTKYSIKFFAKNAYGEGVSAVLVVNT